MSGGGPGIARNDPQLGEFDFRIRRNGAQTNGDIIVIFEAQGSAVTGDGHRNC